MTTASKLDDFPGARDLIAAPTLPELGSGPRHGVEPLDSLKRRLTAFFERTPLSASSQELVRGAVYLWHDHMDESHTISQAIETPDGSLLHGILHRREPDYWNSKYWLRRVGQHPCYQVIAERVSTLLQEAGEVKLADKLVSRGQWDAFAFVDACEKAGATQQELLQKIQQIEFEALLEYFLARRAAR